jgi:hypothetical protein
LSATNRTLLGPNVIAPNDLASTGPLTIPFDGGRFHAAGGGDEGESGRGNGDRAMRFMASSGLGVLGEPLRAKRVGGGPQEDATSWEGDAPASASVWQA